MPTLSHRSLHWLAAGMALANLAFVSAPAAAAPISDASAIHPYAAFVTEAAQRFGIPEGWIWSVMRVESRGNARAVSPVGAMGLMQIMPATWATLTARFSLGGDPFDIRANIHAGAAYLRMMWDRYGDVAAMLAAYNAGPRRADAWMARRSGLPAETVSYVARIAPVIGGGGAPAVAAVQPVHTDWRGSVLFAARASAPSERNAATSSGPAESSANTVPAPQRPPASLLFVTRSGGERP